MIESLKLYALALSRNLVGSESDSKQKAIDYKTFESFYPEIQKSDFAVIIFKGTPDASTGINWCPDCVRAEPHIEKVLMPRCNEKNIPIHHVHVGDRAEWKDQKHPLRRHKIWEVTSIPTVVLVKKGKPLRRIGENYCTNDEYLQELLEDLD